MSAPGGNNFHPESLGELARFAQYMFAGVEKQLTHLSDKIDRLDVVTREQYREDMEDLRSDVKELERDLEANKAKASSDLEAFQARLSNQTKWFIGSIIFPLAGLILTIYSMFKGAS